MAKKTSRRAKSRREKKTSRRDLKRRGSWVRDVAERSDAMDLPRGIFKGTPVEIARRLRRSALRSTWTKGSMLNLYANRAGRSLAARDRRRLERAKIELRRIFGRAA